MNCKFARRISAVRLSVFLSALFVITLLGLPAATYAVEIIYTGSANQLREMPSWFSGTPSKDAFFPGTKTAPLSSGNIVTVNYNTAARGAENPRYILGGISELENTSDNKVILQKMSGDALVHGGHTVGGAALRNTVTVNRGSEAGVVCGGISWNKNVVGNTVTISGGSVEYGACGGVSLSGDVVDNAVIFNSGSAKRRVYGGEVEEHGNAVDNSVTIGGGSVRGEVVGGFSASGDVLGNKITISGGSVEETVFGGLSKKGKTTGNIVAISGGYAGYAGGGVCFSGESVDNTVTISGGVVASGAFGGFSKGGNASGNTVTISGGSVKAMVMGGNSGGGDAVNNIVTISGRPNMAETEIWGGHAETYAKDDFSGNTLNLKNKDVSVAGVRNFEYYNFDLPKDMASRGVMLRLTKQVELKATTIGVSLQSGLKLRQGDKISLIHSTGGVENSPTNTSCKTQQGGVLYEFSIYTDKNNLWAEVTKVGNAAK